MTDQLPPAQTGDNDNGQPTTGSETKPNNGKTPIASLPPDIQTYIEELRAEAESNRKAKKAADAAAKLAEEKRLADEKQWEALANTRGAELEKLKPVADQYEAITAAFNASLDNRLKQIPDDIRKKTVDPIRAALPPVDFSNWLDANVDILRARQAPDLDGGAGSNANPTIVKLSQTELEMARNMNISPEKYAQRKAERDAESKRRDV